MTYTIEIINYDKTRKAKYNYLEPQIEKEVVDWLDENNMNMTQEYNGFDKISLIFQCIEDAMAFKLRWL